MSTGAKSTQRWQSDIIVELLHRYEFPFISMNPGASFRGLHDSLVNYGAGKPPMLLCQHEETAVQIAHGYAKATGTPMACILHNLVGLLHANMAIYYAFIDRAPIFIIGATGPMDESKRRPHIDWIHTANVQGEAVRHYTKWDYQPASIDGVPDSFARAYGVMMTEPHGPIYMCYDAALQEAPLEREVKLPPANAARAPTRIAPEAKALEDIADRLLAAEHPVLMAEFVGRAEGGFEALTQLAETIGAPVYDLGTRLNFPNPHPLNRSMDGSVFEDADAILGLDMRDWEKPTTKLDSTTRRIVSRVPEDCAWMELGFADLGIGKWAMDYRRWQPCELRVLADTSVAIPALTDITRRRIAGDARLARHVADRARAVGESSAKLRATWQEEARDGWDSTPLSLPRLAGAVWDAIKDEDWVLTAGTLEDWARKLWRFDKPYRHAGRSLGTATQIGISLGVALGHRDRGRLVVDLQPDGDLMFDAGALWVAAKHKIPMLAVMFNNRAYYNDWEHQIRMARLRGTPVERAHIGMDLYGPEPDFAQLAKSMGWYAEGPIDKPADLAPALKRAIAQVKEGKPALLDTITLAR